MTIGVVSVKASTTILVAAVGAGIDMVDTELLFAIAARLAGRDAAHGTERQSDCVRWMVGQRCVNKYVKVIRGQDAGGRGSGVGNRKPNGATRKIIAA
jgi:hypothetical protein